MQPTCSGSKRSNRSSQGWQSTRLPIPTVPIATVYGVNCKEHWLMRLNQCENGMQHGNRQQAAYEMETRALDGRVLTGTLPLSRIDTVKHCATLTVVFPFGIP